MCNLALVNLGRAKFEIDDPRMGEFIAALDRINLVADKSPGFLWRQSAEENDYLQPYEDKKILFNFSVWSDIESLKKFVYRGVHSEILRRRQEWFERFDAPYLALWWISPNTKPSVDEALSRIEFLQAHGPSEYAFTFSHYFPPAVLALPKQE